ncbi:GDP-L-fucose synthase [Fimbriimonas ginsengisoli]|uniref:GDP-L-fucose synthase n=1 Tax=Fimbriimonas ginsengisoli Gsoil 348 TaxID=661478 RepID=A0A068NV54_FIMGI|nr:GDP-L-fucose synthase [Fimbriimonas ginsengisoli]AIE86635.1 NAD-dependent epimerase/dehydratase [Fimbriimonas ginsengisoli Gsoil 348]
MRRDARIYVAGHRGLVGSAIVRRLQNDGYENLIVRTHKELDLTDREAVESFFTEEKPEYVILAAAKVGGIHANNAYPADFIFQNLAIQGNVIDAAYRHKTEKLLFLGSSCIYPKLAPQPMREDVLLTGPLEPTNQAYAIAKIAGLEMCRSYYRQYGFRSVSLMPTNLYGPYDNFDLENSHVLPAMMRKFHDAKERGDKQVTLWGSGTPRREFLHADDLASAAVFLMNNHEDPDLVNVGVGEDVTIRELAETVRSAVGWNGEIVWDSSKPDGTPRKLMDVSKIHSLGWRHSIEFEDGVRDTYEWFKNNMAGTLR